MVVEINRDMAESENEGIGVYMLQDMEVERQRA